MTHIYIYIYTTLFEYINYLFPQMKELALSPIREASVVSELVVVEDLNFSIADVPAVLSPCLIMTGIRDLNSLL